MITVDRGGVVTIEGTFKEYQPFGTLTLTDPSPAPKMTVYDPNGTAVLLDQNMINVNVGHWYYNIQTQSSWVRGMYDVKISAVLSTYTDVIVKPDSFVLE